MSVIADISLRDVTLPAWIFLATIGFPALPATVVTSSLILALYIN